MENDPDFVFEIFEEYYGDIKQVQKIINECKICGGQYIFSHLSDYKNLFIREIARCPDCGTGKRKVLHKLN